MASCQTAHRVQGRAGHTQGAKGWSARLSPRPRVRIQAEHHYPHRTQVHPPSASEAV